MLTAYCHSSTSGWRTVEDLDRISDLREEPGNLLWVEADSTQLDHGDLATIAEEFNLHRLAVEDATDSRQRPKLDSYPDHLFVVLHEMNEVDGQLEPAQIACFIGERYVLTVHESQQRVLDEAKERWKRCREELGRGPAYLLYTLLDVIVDDYERIADNLEDEVEALEDVVLAKPDSPIQRALYSLKQRVSRLRRYAFPVARILEWITDPVRDTGFPSETTPLFRDVEDHISRITDQVRGIDDLSQAVIDLQRAELGLQLSETNKKLTAWAAIIAVPTFIASVYGMNFALVPESGRRFGFWFALALMALTAAALFSFFRRRRWI
jgi:magnesium transporter